MRGMVRVPQSLGLTGGLCEIQQQALYTAQSLVKFSGNVCYGCYYNRAPHLVLTPQHDCPVSKNHPNWSFKDTRITQTSPAELCQFLGKSCCSWRNERAQMQSASRQADRHHLPRGPGATVCVLTLSMK